MKLKIISRAGTAFVALFALNSAAQAAYINGTINFAGVATLDASPPTATKFLSFSGESVLLTTGSYIGAGPGAAFTPFTFGAPGTVGVMGTGGPGVGLPAPVSPLWTATGGWSFTLTGITLNTQTGSQRDLEGSGMAYGPLGFSPTPGFWTLSTSGTASTLTFSSFSSSVPDAGTTVGLLGLALVGLHGARRKFAKR